MPNTTAALPAEAVSLLDYWFGDGDDAEIAGRRASLWWGKDVAVDDDIRSRFGGLHAAAIAGALDHWLAHPRGRLALILLVDQCPRAMFRDDARAWTDDERALGWSIAGLRCGDDRALRPIERVFVYMPLEHAEDMLCQHAAVGCFEALAASVPEAYRATFDTFTGFARSHLALRPLSPSQRRARSREHGSRSDLSRAAGRRFLIARGPCAPPSRTLPRRAQTTAWRNRTTPTRSVSAS